MEVFLILFFPLQSTDEIICLGLLVLGVFGGGGVVLCFFKKTREKRGTKDPFSVKMFFFGDC